MLTETLFMMTLFTECYQYTLLRDVLNGQELECVSAIFGAEKVNSGGVHHSNKKKISSMACFFIVYFQQNP